VGTPAMKPLDHWYQYADISSHAPRDCWPWLGPLNTDGYGDMNIARASTRQAHRFAYLTFVGPIAEGLVVCHHCDNPRCVRPSHLFLGTQGDNIADKVSKGRQARGSRNGASKLTDEQYAEIEHRAAAGEPQNALAAEFGVTPQAVSQYLKRRRAVTG
jgi:hypothetical protein